MHQPGCSLAMLGHHYWTGRAERPVGMVVTPYCTSLYKDQAATEHGRKFHYHSPEQTAGDIRVHKAPCSPHTQPASPHSLLAKGPW